MRYLYHGTFDDSYEKIIKDELIKCDIKSDTTDLIDAYLEDNLREGCTFLCQDQESTHAYSEAFEIPVDSLDKDYLFVADNKIVDEMFSAIYSGKNDLIPELSSRYKDSFISYKEYMLIKKEYDKEHFAEFLYFKDIKVTEDDILF